jgi:hypothetical protein
LTVGLIAAAGLAVVLDKAVQGAGGLPKAGKRLTDQGLTLGTSGAVSDPTSSRNVFLGGKGSSLVIIGTKPIGDPLKGKTADDLITGLGSMEHHLGKQTDDLAVALQLNTAALRKSSADLYAASAKARGFTYDPKAKASTSLASRFAFLGRREKGSKDVAVADALVRHFQTGSSPLYTSDRNLAAAIRVLRADQKTLGPKAAAAIGKDIDALKAEQSRRTKVASDKAAAAAARTKAATEAVSSAQREGNRISRVIAAKDPTVAITVPISANTYLNGRLITANLERFTTIVGGRFAGKTVPV